MASLIKAFRDANNGGYVSFLFDTAIGSASDGVYGVMVDGNDYLNTNFFDANLLSVHFSDDPTLLDGATAYAFAITNNGGLLFVDSEDHPDFSGNLVPLVNITSIVKTGSNTVRVYIDQAIVDVDDPNYPATFENMVAYPDWGVRVNDNPATLVDATAGNTYFDLSYESDVGADDPWTYTINVGGSGSFGASLGTLLAGVSGTVAAGSATYEFTASGGIQFGGSADWEFQRGQKQAQNWSGGQSYRTSRRVEFKASGGIQWGGEADWSFESPARKIAAEEEMQMEELLELVL